MRVRSLLGLSPILLVVALASIVAWFRPEPGRLYPIFHWEPPSTLFPLGSGEGGVDVFALVSHGVLHSTALALVVSGMGLFVGGFAGSIAGLWRGRFEAVVLALCDLVQAFPGFLLALAVLAAVREPSRVHLALVFGATSWAPFARLAAARAAQLRGAQFVEAARALGQTELRIVVRHIIPNLLTPLFVQLGGTCAAVVVGEAALTFVGLGPLDGVSLGALLAQGVRGMMFAPHVLITAAATVFCLSLSFQWATDSLRSLLRA